MESDQLDAIVALMGKRFLARTDVRAIQFEDGSYRPIHEKWKVKDIKDHVLGIRSYGHYLLSRESKCKLFAYDLDLDKEARERWVHGHESDRAELTRQLRGLADGIATRASRLAGSPATVAYSGGKGLHVYVFTGLIDAIDAKSCATYVLESFSALEPFRGEVFWRHKDSALYPDVAIEVFPKQDKISDDGLGNLMRLPLGVNARTGDKAFFIDTTAALEELRELDPIAVLTAEGTNL